MSGHWLAIIAALYTSGCRASPAVAPAPATTLAEADVRARERAWLDAYEQRDPAVMTDVLADGFLITFPDGRQMTRAEVIASARAPRTTSDRLRFTTRGTVALARDGVIVLIGQVIESREAPDGRRREVSSSYTDTWVREGATWRVLASQLSRASDPTP